MGKYDKSSDIRYQYNQCLNDKIMTTLSHYAAKANASEIISKMRLSRQTAVENSPNVYNAADDCFINGCRKKSWYETKKNSEKNYRFRSWFGLPSKFNHLDFAHHSRDLIKPIHNSRIVSREENDKQTDRRANSGENITH